MKSFLFRSLSKGIATGLGSGLIPWAPGTFGSLASFPLLWISTPWAFSEKILFWSLLFIVGAWAAQNYDKQLGTQDHGSIVIDEIIGMGLMSLFFQDLSIKNFFLIFIIFRFFDILKIPPVKQIDRWSKTLSSDLPLLRGVGIILDDVVAALQGLLILYALHSF